MRRRALQMAAMIAVIMPTSHAMSQQTSTFDVALDNGDYAGAAKEIDKISEERRNERDLDSYYGRFFAAAAHGLIAEPYLVRAIASARNRPDKDRLAFELARAREVDGFVAKAEADYQLLASASVDPIVRLNSTLALARLRLGSAPEKAEELLTPLLGNSDAESGQWEAQLLLSRAYSIQGREADSKAALAAAWLEAPQAPVPADAIAVTAMDMALNHAAAGNRAGEIGLISGGRMQGWFAGVAQLPACDSFLQPEDFVIVAIAADQKQRPIYSAVRASRPGIAQLFTVPLAVAQQRVEGPAIYVSLRCRSGLDANRRFAGGATSDLFSWLGERGYYPPLSPITPSDGNPLTHLQAQLQKLEARVGMDSPVLAPTLMQIALLQATQSRFGNASNFAQAQATSERILRILNSTGAPTEVLEQVRLQTTLMLAQNQNLQDVAGPAALEVVTAMASRPDTTPAQAYTAFREVSTWPLRPVQKLALADQLMAFLNARGVSSNDQIRQVAELRRAEIMREIGTVAGTRDRLSASGLANDLCDVVDRSPSIPPTAITLTSDDYPKDLLRRNVIGWTAIELSVDAAGKINEQRMVVSQPPNLFDEITMDKLRAVTLLPAHQDDQPIACRGKLQTVRFEIPFRSEYPWSSDGWPFP